jgi:RNA polymerase sigma factor (sigma-70 family)
MVRRAFRRAFDDDEVEDIYANAWLGTLRALERRHHLLSDEEIRRYVFAAVANHASKELRRRKRRPTAPLDNVHAIADDGVPPDERAAKVEESRLTRDLLSSLPPRRRAVMLFRYGWGLEPRQVCGLVKGLSPRAYRKEITRGIDELTEKLRLVQNGEWCADRESVLKAYAAGLADTEQQRQAQHHLSHCRQCSEFVGRLTGHLHDLGGSVVVPSAVDALDDGRLSLADRVGDAAHRLRESVTSFLGSQGGDGASDPAAQAVSTSSAARGAGAAGTGALAKLAGIGTAAKLGALCLGGGAAATACLAAGVIPAKLPGLDAGAERTSKPPAAQTSDRAGEPPPATPLSSQLGREPAAPPEPSSSEPPSGAAAPASEVAPSAEPASPPPAPAPPPVEPSAPPPQQEFGVASAAPTSSSAPRSTPSPSGSAAQREFGP